MAKNLSSVHRTLIDACRTTLVWTTDLILFYASYKHQYGERPVVILQRTFVDWTPCFFHSQAGRILIPAYCFAIP